MEIFGIDFLKSGNKIKIKEKNKGKFTASAKAAGHSVQEHAKAVLNDPNATPLQKKRANFARNSRRWSRKHQEGGQILLGLVPGIGTYQDFLEFNKNPNLKNFGWMLASGIGDVLFFTGAGAGIKALRLAKAANTYRKGVKADRAIKLLTAQNKFNNVRDQKLLGTLDRNIRPEIQSLSQSVVNYRNAVDKANLAHKYQIDETKRLAKKASKDISKDAVINTGQYYEQKL